MDGGIKGAKGNTPTVVGKTPPAPEMNPDARKHPHGRGEDSLAVSRLLYIKETPPRSWGRPKLQPTIKKLIGNTPTVVGKTRCL